MANNKNINFYKNYNLKTYGLPEIQVFGHYETGEALPPIDIHTHEGFEICYLEKGHQTYNVKDRDYLIKTGEIFLTKPGEVHSSGRQAQEKGHLYWIHVTPEIKGKSFLGLTKKQGMLLLTEMYKIKDRHFPASTALQMAIKHAHKQILRQPSAFTNIALANAMISILLELINSASIPKKPEAGDMNRIISYIDDNLEETVRVPALAKQFGLSTSWFKARFKKETGLSPAAYVLRKRIYKAREFMEKGKGNVSDAAMKYGFSSSQHFATAFKRYNKQNPREILARSATD
jgi:AraC-like DNA-binding protein/mannose-6-phosphate isomerase-like protein (cupin superfamily)